MFHQPAVKRTHEGYSCKERDYKLSTVLAPPPDHAPFVLKSRILYRKRQRTERFGDDVFFGWKIHNFCMFLSSVYPHC